MFDEGITIIQCGRMAFSTDTIEMLGFVCAKKEAALQMELYSHWRIMSIGPCDYGLPDGGLALEPEL